ncbi:MAG: c-type cytochrome [Anaerolineales bacterium]|nr:c-type cytochrome [Anaerolineales bacterium]
MQVKVAIGTIALMITMVIFGYSALREPARLEQFTRAEMGRSIETGAELFASNCSNCHGVNGKAEECYDQGTGEQIGCQGLPLNYQPLLCGDTSDRMVAMNWQGTKHAFIQSTISSGRPGTVMPTWSDQFGGPMRPDQIRNLANFVLNWETEELCSGPVVTFEWPETVQDFVAQFPEGDAESGKALFVTYGCSGCHGVPDEGVPPAVGPDLSNISETGATRVEGQTAEQYVYHSILYPSDFIAPECPTGPCSGPPSAMPANFPQRMATNPQDLRDILTYLLGE